MTTNPYNNEDLARLLWEAEIVADKYFAGGLVLIRTGEGWRAFLGTLKSEYLDDIESSLDKNVPSFEKDMGNKVSRNPMLTEEFWRLLPDLGFFIQGYRPMKFVDELEDE